MRLRASGPQLVLFLGCGRPTWREIYGPAFRRA